MEINTKRLKLRPLGTKDLYSTIKYAMDDENTKYMCYLPCDTIIEAEEFLTNVEKEWEKESPQFLEFAILYQDCHIGAVRVYFEDTIGELGWIIHKDYWGNGFAYEAATALICYVNEKMNINHFRAHCDTNNLASYKLMEKLGMKRTSIGKRRNRSNELESLEYQYELYL